MADVLILIPARMASHRLPGKPLADIAGEPMIVHVMRRAQAAQLGPVVIATDSEAIAACVEKAGGRAAMTRADHASGSDRIFEALARGRSRAPGRHHRQCPGRPAHDRTGGYRRRDRAARRPGRRYRHPGSGNQPAGRGHQSERGESGRHADCGSAGYGRSISPAPPHRPARVRFIITSASTPFAARRSPDSSALRLRRSNDGKNSSSCAPSKRACASMWPLSTARRSAWTPPRTWTARVRSSPHLHDKDGAERPFQGGSRLRAR